MANATNKAWYQGVQSTFRKANSYAVGLGGSKRSISDPKFIRRDVSRHLPYRQSDRNCSFCFVFVLFLGAFDTRE